MAVTTRIVEYMDDLLETRAVPDYPNALNGLQLANSGVTTRIACGVDFSTRTVRGAAESGADLLIVHHGMFWSGAVRLIGVEYDRLRVLIGSDIAVYASHLPLDRHPLYGNNALLASELGLEPSGDFARYKGISIGVRGTSDLPTLELAERADRFARAYTPVERGGRGAKWTPIASDRRTRSWAICTGAGASSESLREATEEGIDTLIVGEGPHHTAVEAEERGIALIYAGHYATETLGVRALSAHLSARFGIPWGFVDAPTGL